MIKKLIIENYQSHEKSEFNLDPGVNVITGVSQSGKTAILRALYWLLHNRPSGDRMRSSFAEGATKVMIETAEGDSIWHVKDDKVNSYAVNNEVFDKIGKDIPDLAQRLLRISELNVQKQLDEPFLITSSAGEVAKTINRITRLEMVDEWVTDLTQSINALNRERDNLEVEIKFHADKIKSYRVLVDLQPLLDRAKEIEKTIGQSKEKYNKIRYLRATTGYQSNQLILLRDNLQIGVICQKYDGIAQKIEKLTEKAKVARLALKAYRTLQRQSAASESIKKAVALEENKVELVKKAKIVNDTKIALNYLNKAQRVMENYKTHLHNAVAKMEVCPTCLQPITQATVKKIMGEV